MKEKNGIVKKCRHFNLHGFLFLICVLMMVYRLYLAVRIHPAFSSLCYSSFSEKLNALEFSVFPSLVSSLFLLMFNLKSRRVSVLLLCAVTFSSLIPLCGVIILSRVVSPYISAYIVSSLIFMFDMLGILTAVTTAGCGRSKFTEDTADRCDGDTASEEKYKTDAGMTEKKIYTEFFSVLVYFLSAVFVLYLLMTVCVSVVRPLAFLLIVPYLPFPHFLLALVILSCDVGVCKLSSLSRAVLSLSAALPCLIGVLLASGISLCLLFYIFFAVAVIAVFTAGFFIRGKYRKSESGSITEKCK